MGEPAGSVRARWTGRGLRGIRWQENWRFALSTKFRRWRWRQQWRRHTEFCDLRELRVKESDRIACIARELQRAGVTVREAPDGLSVTGTGEGPRRSRVRPDGDHRIAMAGAILD